MEVLTGRRRGSMLYIYQNFRFRKNKELGGKLYVRCCSLDCPATGYITANQEFKLHKGHNHNANIEELNTLRLREDLRKSAIENPETSLHNIFNITCQRHPDAAGLTTYTSSREFMSRERSAMKDALVVKREEPLECGTEQNARSTTKKKRPARVAQDNIMCTNCIPLQSSVKNELQRLSLIVSQMARKVNNLEKRLQGHAGMENDVEDPVSVPHTHSDGNRVEVYQLNPDTEFKVLLCTTTVTAEGDSAREELLPLASDAGADDSAHGVCSVTKMEAEHNYASQE